MYSRPLPLYRDYFCLYVRLSIKTPPPLSNSKLAPFEQQISLSLFNCSSRQLARLDYRRLRPRLVPVGLLGYGNPLKLSYLRIIG